MNTIKKRNILVYLALVAIVGATLTACDKQVTNPADVSYRFVSPGTGALVVPSSGATGTSLFTATYDATFGEFNYTLRWYNLWTVKGQDTITKANLYGPALAGANADSVRAILILPDTKRYTNGTIGTDSVSITLPDYQWFNAQEKADILAGKWYYQIYTKKYPNGIVRGQLNPTLITPVPGTF